MKNNNPLWKQVFIYSLAALVILGFIGVMVILIFHLAPASNDTLLNVLAGAFTTMTIQIVNYFYGSSKSSADKTDMLYNSTPIIPPTDTPKS